MRIANAYFMTYTAIYSRATLIGPPCAKPADGSSSWKVPLTVLLVLLVIGSSRQKAVQASERGPVLGKVHLAKGLISVAPLYLPTATINHRHRHCQCISACVRRHPLHPPPTTSCFVLTSIVGSLFIAKHAVHNNGVLFFSRRRRWQWLLPLLLAPSQIPSQLAPRPPVKTCLQSSQLAAIAPIDGPRRGTHGRRVGLALPSFNPSL